MKYLEREFYKGYWYFGNGSSATITNWFKVKDNVFRGIKHVTKRHRRSATLRDLKRLYNYTPTELALAAKYFTEIEFGRHHGITCKWVKKHRIHVYHY